MPNWVKITVTGVLLCTLCAGVVSKTWEGYSCSNKSCPYHDDEPVRQNARIPYTFDIRASLGTGSASDIGSALQGTGANDLS